MTHSLPHHLSPSDNPPGAVAAGEDGRWAFIGMLREGVLGLDGQGRCAFANRAAAAMLGYGAPGELIGLPVERDGERLRRRDGSTVPAVGASFPLAGEGGSASGTIVVLETHLADKAGAAPPEGVPAKPGAADRAPSRASEARFRRLADSIPQLAWMTGPDGQINWYNRRWYDYTGTTAEAMRGWGWKAVHHPDHVDRVVAHINAAFTGGVAWEDTFPLRGKDGDYRWFLSRAMPIHDEPDEANPDGRILGWFGTNTDIQDLREAEERLNAAMAAAEEANRAKSDFIANMSHELRTPLSAIIGYSEMMREEVADGGDPADFVPDMQKVEANARHLLGLINDVLDLSKIESGKMEVFAETFEVATTLHEVAATVRTLVAKKNNTLVMEVGDDLGAMHSDVTKLRQILLNLLSNAAKFTEGGTITLSGTRIVGAGPEEWLAFRVSDDGLGMTEEQLGRLFTRFSQADASTTRQFGGTGLGLSITKAFSLMLGGDIVVESAPGHGSTFTVMLPATAREPAGEDLPIPDLPPMRRHDTEAEAGRDCVLVIDDDPAQRDLMARFLAREGFEARLVADGPSGIAMARDLKPRAILLDVTMPGMDGWSVLSVLKADPELCDIPVVMITFVSERGLALSLGAAEYVMKPVVWERFKQVMDHFRPDAGAVLVVDDDADLRSRMRAVLERDGWTVTEAGDGREGLEAVARLVPQVVLLDVNMPVMDGFTFLQRFRALPGCGEVPVVVLTASDLTAEDRARLRGASQVLNKGSTDLDAMVRKLRTIAEVPQGPPPASTPEAP